MPSSSIFARTKAQLKGRFRNYRVARYVLYITAFWAISIFLAPLSLEPGTVDHLDANANWVDHGDQWADMARYNPYAAGIYLGDFNCHQKASRSLTVNDNELPVCARDVGIAAGTVIGALILFFTIRTPYMFLTFLSVVPERFRTPLLKRLPPWLAAGLIAFPLLAPTGFDGFYQLLTSYESTNIVRLVTGFFLGILLSWGFGSAFLSVTVPLPMYEPENGRATPEKSSSSGSSTTSPPSTKLTPSSDPQPSTDPTTLIPLDPPTPSEDTPLSSKTTPSEPINPPSDIPLTQMTTSQPPTTTPLPSSTETDNPLDTRENGPQNTKEGDQ